jgi:hypothetical protein
MNKVVNLKQNVKEDFTELIDEVKKRKRNFIPPKERMKDSLENDARYLASLGSFIQEAQKKLEEYIAKKNMFEASRLQVEIMDAIAKFQANEGLVNDKAIHFEKVFLPLYEQELAESKEKFDEMYEKAKVIIERDIKYVDDQERIRAYMKKEFNEYLDSDLKDDYEFKNYVYKIFKRLISKFEQINSK